MGCSRCAESVNSHYQKRYDALVDRFDTARACQKVLAQQITARQARRQQIEMFLIGLKKRGR